MAILDDPYNTALINFGRNLHIKGIVCVTSHWISPGAIQITSNPVPFIQHNFSGYQKELYDIEYGTPYSAELVEHVSDLLEENNFEVAMNPNYGFDHGVWMPLKLIRPEGDLPVVQISLPLFEDPRMIMQLGHVLSELRKEGILLLATGQAAFNPQKIVWHARGEDVNPKIKAFEEWLVQNLITANIEELLDYRKTAPHAEFAHPSTANLLPLFFTIGSSLHGDKPVILHRAFRYTSSALLSFCLSDSEIPNLTLS